MIRNQLILRLAFLELILPIRWICRKFDRNSSTKGSPCPGGMDLLSLFILLGFVFTLLGILLGTKAGLIDGLASTLLGGTPATGIPIWLKDEPGRRIREIYPVQYYEEIGLPEARDKEGRSSETYGVRMRLPGGIKIKSGCGENFGGQAKIRVRLVGDNDPAMSSDMVKLLHELGPFVLTFDSSFLRSNCLEIVSPEVFAKAFDESMPPCLTAPNGVSCDWRGDADKVRKMAPGPLNMREIRYLPLEMDMSYRDETNSDGVSVLPELVPFRILVGRIRDVNPPALIASIRLVEVSESGRKPNYAEGKANANHFPESFAGRGHPIFGVRRISSVAFQGKDGKQAAETFAQIVTKAERPADPSATSSYGQPMVRLPLPQREWLVARWLNQLRGEQPAKLLDYHPILSVQSFRKARFPSWGEVEVKPDGAWLNRNGVVYAPWTERGDLCRVIGKLEQYQRAIFSQPYRRSYGRVAFLVALLEALKEPYEIIFSLMIGLLTGTLMYFIVHNRRSAYSLLLTQGFRPRGILLILLIQALVILVSAVVLALGFLTLWGFATGSLVASATSIVDSCGVDVSTPINLMPLSSPEYLVDFFLVSAVGAIVMVSSAWFFLWRSGLHTNSRLDVST